MLDTLVKLVSKQFSATVVNPPNEGKRKFPSIVTDHIFRTREIASNQFSDDCCQSQLRNQTNFAE